MPTVNELTEQIRELYYAIQRIEGTVIGPGPERDRLLTELSDLQQRKRAIGEQRDALKRQHSAMRLFAEFGGGQREVSNDTRTVEQRKKDIEEANIRKRQHANEQLEMLGDLLTPLTFKQ